MRKLSILPFIFALSAMIPAVADSPKDLRMAYAMQQAVLRDQNLAKIEELLNAGFKPSHPIGCGTFDALDGAVEVQNPQMVSLLLKHGARPKESTVVAAAFLSNEDASLDILKQFLAVGANVNSLRVYSQNPPMTWTPLDQAVWREHADVVKLLLAQRGVHVNVINGDGQTPLMIAVQKGNKDIVQMLLAAGADPLLATPRHETALTVSNSQIDNQRSIQHFLLGDK
jgi:ankyrin repeat protein